VYRICDVVRGAHSLVIAVGRPPADKEEGNITTTDGMLEQWGKRIWTFPEVLLAPAGKDIKVYTRGTGTPISVAKNQFAARVWKEDAQIARQVCGRPLDKQSNLTDLRSWWTTTKVTSS
jgi:hypothetical protein